MNMQQTGGTLRHTKSNRLGQVAVAIVALAFFVGCFYLFSHQTFSYLYSGSYDQRYYFTDFYSHMSIARSQGALANYSFNSLMFNLLFKLWPNPMAYASYLTLAVAGAVFATMRLLRDIMPNSDKQARFWVALLCNLEMPLYFAGTGLRYLGAFSGSIWHNATYIVQKPFAVLAMCCLVRLMQSYRDRRDWKTWGLFALFMAFTTWVKPSFLTTIAPAMAMFFLLLLIPSKGKGFWNTVWLGCALLPALGIALMQSTVLYPDGQGIAYHWMFCVAFYSPYPYFAVFRSLVFPIAAIPLLWRQLKNDRVFQLVACNALFGLGYAVALKEIGRSTDANFFWGAHFAVFLLFVVCAAALWRSVKEKPLREMTVLQKGRGVLLSGLLVWHVICGIQYFVMLVLGGDFTSI